MVEFYFQHFPRFIKISLQMVKQTVQVRTFRFSLFSPEPKRLKLDDFGGQNGFHRLKRVGFRIASNVKKTDPLRRFKVTGKNRFE